MNIENEVDLLKYLVSQEKFLSFYINQIKRKGYSVSEYNYISGRYDNIKNLMNDLIFSNLKNLLIKSSNRRLKEIILGEELLTEIIMLPHDYKLIIDVDDIENLDVSNALIFRTLNKKYCIFQHKKFCKEGLSYIQGKWQKL